MRTIWSLWQDAVSREHDGPAYLVDEPDGWREVSWQEAAQAVDELAHGLLALGIRKGDAFGILGHTRLEWVLFDYALAHVGATAAPIYPSSSQADSRHILEDSGAVGVLVESDEDLPLIEGAELGHVFTFAGLERLRESGREHARTNPRAVEEARAHVGEDDLFTFIYTSGTTGPPKGCMILNRNYYEMCRSAALAEDFFLPSDVLLLYLPLAHNFGRYMHLLGAYVGYTVAFCPDARRLGEVMPAVRPTVLPTVPRVLEKVHTAVTATFDEATGAKRRLIDWSLSVGERASRRRMTGRSLPPGLAAQHALADKLVYSKVKSRLGGRMRAVISGGAPLATEINAFFHKLDVLVLEGYGQTEGTTACSCNLPGRVKLGTVGPALPNIEVAVADDGEILLRGPTVFAGYWQNEEATKAALPGDGWLHTGDVGSLDEDGFLTVTDRKKDIIVTAGGKNVAPQNIENLLKGSPFVSQALVVGDRRPFLTALITLDADELGKWAQARGVNGDVGELAQRDDVEALVREVVDDTNARLAHFEQIRAWTILPRDFLPEEGEITPTLKLKRRVCEDHFAREIEALYTD
ncbi:MAG TPA: long-chain fatty acid--CoA ligase [Gaiellaceae bacterium]|nr:long-chain fatty acid--CoA ligase [Gaiellaceae bacterium]